MSTLSGERNRNILRRKPTSLLCVPIFYAFESLKGTETVHYIKGYQEGGWKGSQINPSIFENSVLISFEPIRSLIFPFLQHEIDLGSLL